MPSVERRITDPDLGSVKRPKPQKKEAKKKRRRKPVAGWREWIALPDLGVPRIKAKIDTGARSSTIHAWNIRPFEHDGEPWVSFEVHPVQRNNRDRQICTAPLVDRRRVKSSSGHGEKRYVIRTRLLISDRKYSIEMTLTNRDHMGFRLLLGRTAVRNRFLVDPGRSFLFGK